MKTYLYVLNNNNKVEMKEDEALVVQNTLFQDNHYSWVITFKE